MNVLRESVQPLWQQLQPELQHALRKPHSQHRQGSRRVRQPQPYTEPTTTTTAPTEDLVVKPPEEQFPGGDQGEQQHSASKRPRLEPSVAIDPEQQQQMGNMDIRSITLLFLLHDCDGCDHAAGLLRAECAHIVERYPKLKSMIEFIEALGHANARAAISAAGANCGSNTLEAGDALARMRIAAVACTVEGSGRTAGGTNGGNSNGGVRVPGWLSPEEWQVLLSHEHVTTMCPIVMSNYCLKPSPSGVAKISCPVLGNWMVSYGKTPQYLSFIHNAYVNKFHQRLFAALPKNTFTSLVTRFQKHDLNIVPRRTVDRKDPLVVQGEIFCEEYLVPMVKEQHVVSVSTEPIAAHLGQNGLQPGNNEQQPFVPDTACLARSSAAMKEIHQLPSPSAPVHHYANVSAREGLKNVPCTLIDAAPEDTLAQLFLCLRSHEK